MTTYYADNVGGSNSNNGTSILTPFATIAYSLTQMSNGDNLELLGGDTFTESNSTALALGTITSYGSGQATLTGTAAAVTLQFTTAPPTLTSNLTFNGASSANVGFYSNTTGSTVYSAGYTISGCTFENLNTHGIRFGHGSADNGGLQNVTISNNTFNNIVLVGIWIGSSSGTQGTNYNWSNLYIYSNTISNITGNTAGSGTSYGWGMLIQYVNTAGGSSLIYGNTIHDTGVNVNAALSGGGTAFQCEGCSGLSIFNNIAYNAYNTNTSSDGGGGFDIDVDNINCICYNNYAYNCDGPGLSFYAVGNTYTGNKFYCNICINVARNTPFGGLFISGTSPYILYNNTIIVNGTVPCVAFATVGYTPTCKVLNCCFIAPAGVPTVLIYSGTTITSMVMDGNYHQSGDGLFLCTDATGTQKTTLASWLSDTGFETHGVAAGHCHFVQPFPPPTTLAGAAALAPATSSSPLINAGANLLSLYSITPPSDFLGNSWTQNSIGAIYVAGTPTPFATSVYSLNPLAWWRLAETSGSVALDTIGSFANLSLVSTTQGGISLAPGDGSPSSYSFNGSTSEVTGVITPHTFALTSCSVAFIINPATVSVSLQDFFTFSDHSGNLREVACRLADSSLIFIIKDASSGNVTATYTTSFAINTTYFGVVTWTGTTQTCYINGGSAVTPSYSSQAALSGGLPLKQPTVGYAYAATAGQFYSGLVGEIAFFQAVLTQAQSATLYASLTFTAGTATLGTVESSSIAVSSTNCTGGTSPYTYQWQQSTNGISFTSSSGTGVTTLSATITGLTPSTLYYFRLQFTDSASSPNISYSNIISATTEATLVAGTATIGTILSTSIAASATNATGGDSPYALQWQQSTNNVSFTNSSGTGVTTLSATITGLSISTLYYIRLRYTDSNSVVVYSNVISGTTEGTLTAGTATLGAVTTTISVTSTAATGGLFPYSYQWQQSLDGSTYVSSSGTGVTTLSATISGLIANTLYYVRLQVTDSQSNIVYSNVLTATPLATNAIATLSGPTSGFLNGSSIYSVSLNQQYTGIIVPADSSNQGTFSPLFLSWNNTSQAQSFIYTPSTTGNRTISITASPSVAISGSPIALSVQNLTSIVLTGPSYVEYLGGVQGFIGVPSANFTVTPNGLFTGTVTMSDASVAQGCVSGGTFTPSSLTFNNSAVLQTFTYTPNSYGPRIISIESHPSITKNAGIRLIV